MARPEDLFTKALERCQPGSRVSSLIGQYNLLAEIHRFNGVKYILPGDERIAPDLTIEWMQKAVKTGSNQAVYDLMKSMGKSGV